jgi:hypothetical protein
MKNMRRFIDGDLRFPVKDGRDRAEGCGMFDSPSPASKAKSVMVPVFLYTSIRLTTEPSGYAMRPEV